MFRTLKAAADHSLSSFSLTRMGWESGLGEPPINMYIPQWPQSPQHYTIMDFDDCELIVT